MNALPRLIAVRAPSSPPTRLAAPMASPSAHRIDPLAANTAIADRLVTRLAILALALASRNP